MSRQNKVNPGMYTQRGRLAQDDAAREMKRQREVETDPATAKTAKTAGSAEPKVRAAGRRKG